MGIIARNSSTDEINKKLDELKNSIKLDDVRTIIVKTEEELRDLIDSTLSRTHGVQWENDPIIGWSNSKKKELENRKNAKKTKFPEQLISDRLLDHGYIHDLMYLIQRNESVFKRIFSDSQKVLNLLNLLGERRNLIMHSEKEIEEYQKHLCLGICGYLEQILKQWKLGYRRKAKEWNADIRLSAPINTSSSNEILQNSLNNLIQMINQKAIGTITESNENNDRIITVPLKQTTLVIRISKTSIGNFGPSGEYHVINVNLQSGDYDTLTDILTEMPYKYWTFSWIIPEGLDAISTIGSIEKIRKMQHSGSSVSENGILTGRGIHHYLQHNSERAVRVDISGGINHPTKITLAHDGGKPNDGFSNAHNVLSPDEILAMVYGERTPNHINKLVEEACD